MQDTFQKITPGTKHEAPSLNMNISVIIPAFNASLTIRDALSSVEAQGGGDMEIIVVDDVSTDDTARILRAEYEGRPGYRIVIRERNGGPAAARNDAVALARGEWLAFLDGDDAWLPDRLAVQLTLATEHPDVALWCGGVAAWGDTKSGASGSAPVDWRPLDLDEFVFHNPVATSTVLLRRDVFERAGGFDKRFRGPEDYDLWMRVVATCKAARIERPLARYRSVPGSLSMDDRKFLPQVLAVLEKAFGEGGALAARRGLHETAVSNQYWNASWMAFNRGARGRALAFWLRAYLLNLRAGRRVRRPWWRLLARYVAGRPEAAGAGEAKLGTLCGDGGPPPLSCHTGSCQPNPAEDGWLQKGAAGEKR